MGNCIIWKEIKSYISNDYDYYRAGIKTTLSLKYDTRSWVSHFNVHVPHSSFVSSIWTPVKGLPLNFIILAISLHDRKNKPSSSWLLFNICIGKNLAVGKVLIFILLHQYENQYKTNFSRSFHMCECCITNSTRVRPFQRLDRLGYYK